MTDRTPVAHSEGAARMDLLVVFEELHDRVGRLARVGHERLVIADKYKAVVRQSDQGARTCVEMYRMI
ncbi:hypothetical protein FA09DRAFT_313104, partial [Tilletiopsis washingtonensis]